ncbi:hypothetical protein [Streptomyces sp. NPDC054995]
MQFPPDAVLHRSVATAGQLTAIRERKTHTSSPYALSIVILAMWTGWRDSLEFPFLRIGSASTEVELVDFDQLASTLARLLKLHWSRERLAFGPVTQVAELYLFGLLTWIVQHPDRSGEDAAKLTLSQLL